jgi:putative transposase
VYYVPRPVSEADLALMRRIDESHLEHPRVYPASL